MCSILGSVNLHCQKKDIEDINRLMKYRGPDNSNVIKIDTNSYFAHNRLAIIDLDHQSNQPFYDEEKRYTIVFNGEIYNYTEIREELMKSGHTFRTKSDTEVLLKSFIQWKEKCLNKFNGMFAFAIYDTTTKQVFIARDRMGVKPLYYYHNNSTFIFASELEPIKKIVNTSLDEESVDIYFMLGYIPAPKTIYNEIKKFPSAHYAIFNNDELTFNKYWKPNFSSVIVSEQQALENIDYLFEDSVKLRMRSDVPLGAFLSGGIDSSLVVAYMDKLGIRPNTFTIGFHEREYDESKYAQYVAQQFNTNHHIHMLEKSSFDNIDKILNHFYEPFADASAIPTYYVSKFASEHVKVVLSGDGGDELFMGYNPYKSYKFSKLYQKVPYFLKFFIEKTLDAVATLQIPQQEKIKTIQRVVLDNYEDVIATDLAKRSKIRNEFRKDYHSYKIIAEQWIEENLIDKNIKDDFERIIANDFFISLPDDMLTKVDRMSMAHSIEIRNPFLDFRLVEYALSLKPDIKMPGFEQKYLLKTMSESFFDKKFIYREKKGFVVPLKYWLNSESTNNIYDINSQADYLKLVYESFLKRNL